MQNANSITPLPGFSVRQFGFLGPVIALLTQPGAPRYVVSANPVNPIIIDQQYPIASVHETPDSMVEAMLAAAQGVAYKATAQSVMPAAGADLTLSLGSIRCFGVRIRLSQAPQSWPFGAIYFELRDNATVLYSGVCLSNVLPVEIIALGVSNMGGQGSVTTIATPVVFIPGSANVTRPNATVSSTTYVFAETLNYRDLGTVAMQKRRS